MWVRVGAFAVLMTPLLLLSVYLIYNAYEESQLDRFMRLKRFDHQLQTLREENDRLRAQLAQVPKEAGE